MMWQRENIATSSIEKSFISLLLGTSSILTTKVQSVIAFKRKHLFDNGNKNMLESFLNFGPFRVEMVLFLVQVESPRTGNKYWMNFLSIHNVCFSISRDKNKINPL